MHTRKCVGPRMESLETPTLTAQVLDPILGKKSPFIG